MPAAAPPRFMRVRSCPRRRPVRTLRTPRLVHDAGVTGPDSRAGRQSKCAWCPSPGSNPRLAGRHGRRVPTRASQGSCRCGEYRAFQNVRNVRPVEREAYPKLHAESSVRRPLLRAAPDPAATPPGPKTGPQICPLRCAKQYFAEQNSRRDPLARCGVHAFRMPEASMLPPGRPRREKTRLSRLFDFCNDIAEISRWNRFQRNESADPERRILVGGIQPSGRLTLSQTVTGRATGPPIRTRWPAPRNAPPTYRRVPPSAIPCRAPCAQGSSRS